MKSDPTLLKSLVSFQRLRLSFPRRAALALLPAALLMTFAPAEPLIVAHRGASGIAPENTLAAFKLGFEQKAYAIEGDFYLTKDAQIVALHDKDTARVTGKTKTLIPSESTLAELQALDVGLWKGAAYKGEKAPSLAETMAVIPPDGHFFLEIKSGPEILPALFKELEKGPLKPEQITMICFNKEVVRQYKEKAPERRAIWLVSIKGGKDGAPGPVPALDEVLKTARATKADGVGFSANEHTDEVFVKAIKDAGLIASAWTINDPAAAQRFRDYGVDYITTDFPAKISEALAAPR